MDQAAANRPRNFPLRRRTQLTRAGSAGLVVCLLGVGLAIAVRQSRIRHQMQSDPDVATVWLLEATHGPNHTLTRGSTVQRWANAHGIHALGDYEVLTGSFNGEPNGLEFWFGYESHTAVKDLECHRVGSTAFVDDLGQVYHGFLDFQGRTVGVYLPGYDHAARRITCTVHWMPRRPAAPYPVSRPMVFTVPLPPAHRTLPPTASLASGPLSVTRSGITVTLSNVHLSPARLRNLYEGQRDLTFRLDIRGGRIADDNVEQAVTEPQRPPATFSGGSVSVQRLSSRIQGQFYTYTFRPGGTTVTIRTAPTSSASFAVTDPYGTALLPDRAVILMPPTETPTRRTRPPVWTAPVNGAGRGTDCVQLRFHVQPNSRSPKALPPDPIAFDLPVRVMPAAAP